MATRARRSSGVKWRVSNAGDGAHEIRQHHIEALALEGDPEMLRKALNEEVDPCLDRGCYERTDDHRGHRNAFVVIH